MTSITIENQADFGSGGDKKGWAKMGIFSSSEDADNFLHGSSVAAAHVSIRLRFIRKVFGILSAQLIFTTIIGALFIYTPGLKGLVQQWSWMLMVGFILSLCLLVGMMVKRHETPTNYILLFLWTVVEAYTVGVVASFFDQDVVIVAFLLTAGVVTGLTLYTLQSKRDFSAMGSSLFAVLFILIIGGFLQMFLMSETLEFLLSAGGAVVFSLFLIFDLHLLMHRLSPEEYIMATINLYLDIINLFLHLLRLLQMLKRD